MKKFCLLALLFFVLATGFTPSFNNRDTVLAATATTSVAPVFGETDILLLTCMDYRLIAHVTRYMSGQGLEKKYDHVILAGAALGATTKKFPAWNQTFWQHLQVAIDLHKIHKVMIMDHKECGAYKVILGERAVSPPEREMQAHILYLRKLMGQIQAKYRNKLEVELLIMSLDGSVEKIPGATAKAAHKA